MKAADSRREADRSAFMICHVRTSERSYLLITGTGAVPIHSMRVGKGNYIRRRVNTMKKMRKGHMILCLIALFLSNVAIMADMVIIPIADNLFKTYGNPTVINFILSGAAFLSVFTAMACAKLLYKFSKKTILIVSMILFAVGSIFGAAVDNIYYMLIMRILVGVAMGFVNATAMALIAELFDDEGARGKAMGFFNASMAGIGAVISVVAGIFAVNGWREVFKVYWISVPILILMILFIPMTPPDKEEVQENGGTVTPKKPYLSHQIGLLLSCFAYNLIYGVIFYQGAVLVFERGLGNESSAAILSSLGTVGSCVLCILFGFIYAKLKRATIVLGYVGICLSYLMLYLAPNAAVAGVACTLCGAAYGYGFSYFFMRCTVIVPGVKISGSVSLTTAIGQLGMFLSTYVCTILQGVLNTTGIAALLPYAIGAAGVGAVLSIILTIRDRKFPSEYVEQ